jgi:hypothetical protein
MQFYKFFIKVLHHDESFLNVHNLDVKKNGYNPKSYDWLNSFVAEKVQTIKKDGLPLRGAHKKCHEFSPFFSLPSRTKRHCHIFFICLFFNVLLNFIIIACHSIKRHIMALELDINVFKAFFFSMWDSEPEPTF